MDLSFTIAAGLRQHIHSQVRVPQDSWPHFALNLIYMAQMVSQFLERGWAWVYLVRLPLIVFLYQPQVWSRMWSVGGMRIDREKRSTIAPVPLCPPQIPHDLTWARTRAAVCRNRRLTVWATAQPLLAVTAHKSALFRLMFLWVQHVSLFSRLTPPFPF
jgi:hypothetical protein